MKRETKQNLILVGMLLLIAAGALVQAWLHAKLMRG